MSADRPERLEICAILAARMQVQGGRCGGVETNWQKITTDDYLFTGVVHNFLQIWCAFARKIRGLATGVADLVMLCKSTHSKGIVRTRHSLMRTMPRF
jgi:hypothetical protein